jgi:hypothetical protein
MQDWVDNGNSYWKCVTERIYNRHYVYYKGIYEREIFYRKIGRESKKEVW